MMPFLVLLALPLIFLILYFHLHNSKYAKNLHPPGPPGLPFIGNLHQFDGQFLHTYLSHLSKQYGPVMSLKLGFRRVVVISSADALKEIIKSHDAVFSSRPLTVALKSLSYKGLDFAFSPYSDTWREMRKISVVHLFSTKQLQSLGPIFKDEVSKMVEKISRDASSSTITDLSEIMASFAGNTISRVIFGKSYGRNRFDDLFHGEKPLLGGFFMEDYLPLLRWIDRLSGMATRLDKNMSDLHSFCDQMIAEHMNPDRPKSMRGDVIDVLLNIKRDESSSFHLTLDHIKALLVDLIVGGSETTTAALVWALSVLMKKPLLMKKVQAEIRQLAGDNKDMIDEQDIEKLPYLKAVVKETLRLYPPGPLLLPRETTKSCSINGYEIEGGSMVHVNAWAIGRDPTVWKDADEFLPERFLDTNLDVRGQNPKVIPFGFGRKRCPGVEIAVSEIELALANVVYKFEWEMPPGMKEEDIDFDVVSSFVMHKKNALCLVAKFVFA